MENGGKAPRKINLEVTIVTIKSRWPLSPWGNEHHLNVCRSSLSPGEFHNAAKREEFLVIA